MDFKGITWVANVYQKFEAMCLEVEEIIVQDTAKYVEHQVQTVGNTVKKFYSDVVQELLPDDSAGSGKPLHEHAPVRSFKKKRESINRKKSDVKQEHEVTEGKKDGCAMKFRGFDADDYHICSYGGPYRRRRLGRKQIIENEELLQVTRPPYMKKDTSNLSAVHSARVKDDGGTVNSNYSPPSEVERRILKEEAQKDNRPENQHDLTVVNSVRSQESEIKTENEDGLMMVNSVRSQDLEIQPSVATDLPAKSDDCKKETEEDSMETSSSSVSEQKAEILQHLSERSVEESCILVDRDEFYSVFIDTKENNKHKPYKNIRDAISSRLKQNREKEYKRLARQWYAEEFENGIVCGDDPEQIEENQSSSEESEWELL